MADPGAGQDVDGFGRKHPGRGWVVWLSVLVALLVDVLTPAFIVASCALADTLSPEAEDFCGSIVPYVPLAGIVVAIAGAVVSRRQRRDEPWIGGVVVALLLAGVAWTLVP